VHGGGATVTGTWRDRCSATVSSVTGDDGTVVFQTPKIRDSSATLTFTGVDVEKEGANYDDALNKVDSLFLTVP